MELAIQTTDLSRSFGNAYAVKQVNLAVPRGTLYGFLGPNGAGKSTTIKMLTGLMAPTQGKISILGLDPKIPDQSLAIKRDIGVVPEDLALFDNLTAREYLTFIGRMHLMPKNTLDERIDQLVQLMDLSAEVSKLVIEYSHGMKKKLALAAAMLHNPKLLFLDEPFEGVDAVASRAIRKILVSYVERGGTVFVTSHVLEIVERLCSHVGMIVKGTLVEQTTLESLRQNSSLEQRFVDLAGSGAKQDRELGWLGEEEV